MMLICFECDKQMIPDVSQIPGYHMYRGYRTIYPALKQLSRPKSSRNCRVVEIASVLGSRFSKTDIEIVFCENCHLFPKRQK